MTNKRKQSGLGTAGLTPRQKRIKELRAKLNAPDPEEIHPFTRYKLFTYLFVLILPLVPVGLYRIWKPGTEFSPKEQKIWTAVVVAIGVYALRFAFL